MSYSSSAIRTGVLALVLAAGVAPASAQRILTTNAPPRRLPPGGIPKQVTARINAVPASVAAFQQSFQVSLDNVHWFPSIVHQISCPSLVSVTPSTAPCVPGTPPTTVYTRWTQITDSVDMNAAHQQSSSFVAPYQIALVGSNAQMCTVGTVHVRESSGYPVTVTPGSTGSTMPITCKWAVSAVGPYGVPAPGQRQQYRAYTSNVATVTLARNLMGAP